MLYNLLYSLRDYFSGFNVFRYISFRAAGAAVTAFIITLFLGPYVIRWLNKLKVGERIRSDKHYEAYYDNHKKKQGTPTMGGLLILIAVIGSTLLWANLKIIQIWIVIFTMLLLGILGFVDDYIKMAKKKWGLSPKVKFMVQVILTMILFGFLNWYPHTQHIANKLAVPFYKNPIEVIGVVYLFFILLVICGTSNAVNVTDGLDGLATGCIIITAVSYAILSYIVGHVKFAGYLNVLYIPGSGELSVFCSSIVGAGLGFLWFNAHPAEVFMGDVGALSLGGAIGVVSVLIKKELWLLIVGGVFVIEVLSVILQVGSFKIRGKRIFAMAPLHHHFEMRGMPENKITIRFWIIAIICCLIGLGSLKLQ